MGVVALEGSPETEVVVASGDEVGHVLFVLTVDLVGADGGDGVSGECAVVDELGTAFQYQGSVVDDGTAVGKIGIVIDDVVDFRGRFTLDGEVSVQRGDRVDGQLGGIATVTHCHCSLTINSETDFWLLCIAVNVIVDDDVTVECHFTVITFCLCRVHDTHTVRVERGVVVDGDVHSLDGESVVLSGVGSGVAGVDLGVYGAVILDDDLSSGHLRLDGLLASGQGEIASGECECGISDHLDGPVASVDGSCHVGECCRASVAPDGEGILVFGRDGDVYSDAGYGKSIARINPVRPFGSTTAGSRSVDGDCELVCSCNTVTILNRD